MRTYTVTEYDMEDYENYRNNLTTQDVINTLKRINRGYIGDYNYSGQKMTLIGSRCTKPCIRLLKYLRK